MNIPAQHTKIENGTKRANRISVRPCVWLRYQRVDSLRSEEASTCWKLAARARHITVNTRTVTTKNTQPLGGLARREYERLTINTKPNGIE